MRIGLISTSMALLALVGPACGSADDLEGSRGVDADTPTVVPTTRASTATVDTVDDTPTDDTAATTESPATTAAPVELPRPELNRVELELVQVADLDKPVAIAARPGTDDLYVVEQPGRIQRIGSDGSPQVIFDIDDEVSGGNEQGLLGLVFDATGERLYVNHTERSGTTVVTRLTLDGDEVTDRHVIMLVEQLRANHNGGHLAFGPDGYLYVGLGDGGGGGDPGDHGQNPMTLLGSMLRLDVSGDDYAIPPDNPFAQGGAGRPEVFAWGLRNPWKYSFDPATGDLWIADVGQDRFEEVSVVRAVDGGGVGANFGWNEMEGDEPYRSGVEPEDHVGPIVVYGQSNGRCSVTGGVVYRGESIPALSGAYVFGDFCSGELFALDAADPGEVAVLDVQVPQVTSFGVDRAGELYVLSRNGGVFRLVAA